MHIMHIPENVVSFDPAHNAVRTNAGRTLSYDTLVVATELQVNYGAIKRRGVVLHVRIHWELGMIHGALQMVKVLFLSRNVRRKDLVSGAMKPNWLEKIYCDGVSRDN